MHRIPESIREFESDDLDSLKRIYTAAIGALGESRYSRRQVEAWASFSDDAGAFRDWIASATTYVAISDRERIGFAGLQSQGRIASLYVAPEWMRQGVASRLLEKLFEDALARGMKSLTADASEFSRPVFEKHGFRVAAVEHNQYKGVDFTRYSMRKTLES